jgi:hypothetical protein
MKDIKKIADKFEELEKEYDKTFEGKEFKTMSELYSHRHQFVFAKLAEALVEIDNIKEELMIGKRLI